MSNPISLRVLSESATRRVRKRPWRTLNYQEREEAGESQFVRHDRIDAVELRIGKAKECQRRQPGGPSSDVPGPEQRDARGEGNGGHAKGAVSGEKEFPATAKPTQLAHS